MQEVVDALREQQAELTALLRGLDDEGWARPSACEGWTVADVVLHLAQTNEMSLMSLRHSFPAVDGVPDPGAVDAGAGDAVAEERGIPTADLFERWVAGAGELCEAFEHSDPSERVQWVAGTLAARTLATTRLAETWIHTGDVQHAFGVGPQPSGRLWHIARLAHRTLPYAFTQAGRELSGAVAFRLVGPEAATWEFGDDDAPTVISGSALDLCRVASRRVPASATSLTGKGPDADAVLDLVRTWA